MMNKKYFLACVLWASAILVISITPGDQIYQATSGGINANLAHFCEFLVFGYLLCRAFPDFRNPLFVALFYGIITEVLQRYIPGRFFSYNDIALNISGSLFSIAAIMLNKNISLRLKLMMWLNDRNP